MKPILAVLTFIVLLSGGAFAKAAEEPDPAANAALAMLKSTGAKFFYLGRHSGLDGWFVFKDGQVQIAYASPDNKSALVGAMFDATGDNITVQQVSALVQNNKEVADLITAAQKEQAAILTNGTPPAAPTPATTGSIPSMPLSPGERLIQDLSGASTVLIGNASSPEILMVMDPNCPHCQATWKALHDKVAGGKLHLRLVPIGTQNTDNERAAAMLLVVSNPMAAWDSYINGDNSALAGTPPATALTAVRNNHALIDNWKIQSTPYLVYRAKDGKVKILVGEPGKLSVLLNDLGAP